MTFDFSGMSDYEIAEFIENEGPFSDKEFKGIMDAIFSRRGYWYEFESYIRAALSRTYSIFDENTQDDIIQEAVIWLMDFIKDKMDLSKLSSRKFEFFSLVFALRGVDYEIKKLYRNNSRELKALDYASSETEFFDSLSDYTDTKTIGNILISKFKRLLTAVQSELFDLLSQGYTLRDVAKNFGKSVGWVQREKNKIFGLYKKFVLTEARRALKCALKETLEKNMRETGCLKNGLYL